MSKSYYVSSISKEIYNTVKEDCENLGTKNSCISHIKKYTQNN